MKNRQIVFGDDIINNLGLVERNFNEGLERRVADIQLAQEKMGKTKEQIKKQAPAILLKEQAK